MMAGCFLVQGDCFVVRSSLLAMTIIGVLGWFYVRRLPRHPANWDTSQRQYLWFCFYIKLWKK